MERGKPIMKHTPRAGALLAALLAGLTATSGHAQDPEVEKLKRDVTELQRRLDQFETRPGMQLGSPQQAPQTTRIKYIRGLNDRQTPAARLDNRTIDPEMRGFFPVFGSSMLLKLNAKPRVDMTLDTENTNNKYRFVPALFPLPGEPDSGGGEQLGVNSNATQLSFEVRDPENPNGFRFYYQNDFFGDNRANMRYRLQHAYGQTHNVVAGFTFSFFEDPDIWPDTVDYEGPNALIFARRPVVHYKIPVGDESHFTLGVEQPDIYLDTTASPDSSLSTRAPDLGGNFRWEREAVGHVQASAMFRSIGVNGAAGVRDQHEFGWGANISALVSVTERDDFGVLVVGGEGVGGLGNDTSFLNTDAAINASGELEVLPYFSVMGSLRHVWSDMWRSCATYGFVSLDSVDGQAAEAYEESHYASVNLIHQFSPHATVGFEVLYGEKTVRDGRSTDVFRFQVGLAYSIF